MANYFLYAKDFSGSTYRVQHYHSDGLKALAQFKSDVNKIETELFTAGENSTKSEVIYLHWDTKCYKVDEQETKVAYLEQDSGTSGPSPESLIKWVKENCNFGENDQIRLLYIITDGLNGANECSRCNEDMHYETVVSHAFHENLSEIDLSVAASFKRFCLVYRNYELHETTDISKEFDYDKINLSNFAVEKDELKSYIRLKFIRASKHDVLALAEIEKLKKLRNRLFKELPVTSEKKKINLDTKDRNVFLREFLETIWYKNLYSTVYQDKIDIEKYISILINYIVSDAKCYSFDALKFDTNFNKSVEQEQIGDVDLMPEQEVEFPDIILDDDRGIPVVIITTFNLMDKLIFHDGGGSTQVWPASFSKFKSAMECPLFLITDQDVSKSIGYFYTLNAYKQLLANNMRIEPRTRKAFVGGLVLTDTNHFDKYNDYILSATYFGSKKVNFNIGLFYFMLWKNCENKEWMDRNVVEQFKKYTMRRISETVCKIGLSTLPLDPQENTSLVTALWYCVELSSCIFKNDSKNFKQERLRGYHGVACYMIEILKHFNYDLNLQCIEKRIELISYVMILKRIPDYRDRIIYVLESIFKTTEGFLVSEIENPLNLYKLNYLKLNHKTLLWDDIVEEKVNLNDYVYLMYNADDSEARKSYEICKKTFRPFFAIDRNKSFYAELINNYRKVVISNDDDKNKIKITYETIDSLDLSRMLSLYKLFIRCVKDFGRYPTFFEYVEYVYIRKKFYSYWVNIFSSTVYSDIQHVYEQYQEVVMNVEVTEFIKICKSTVRRSERIKAEQQVTFKGDNEISEFISSEERKINLKRKHSTLDTQ